MPDIETAERAVSFLAEQKNKEQPFFLSVGWHKPHVPLIAPEKWWAFYDSLDVDALVPSTFHTPANVPPGTFMRSEFHRGASEEQRRHLYKGYLACTSHMDEQLGKVLDALDDSGKAEETLIVMVGDHGYHIGEQGHWDKMMLLDPALRVPMFIGGPGLPKGSVCNNMVQSHDVFRTVCNYMGWDAQQDGDSQDLNALLHNEEQATGRSHTFSWVEAGKRRGYGIRSTTHRYGLMSFDDGPLLPFLFDLVADPYESNNIAGASDVAAVEADLDKRLREHFTGMEPGKPLAS